MNGKTSVLESHYNKARGLQVCNFIKKRLQQRVFLVNIAKFLRTTILKNICERLLLNEDDRKWQYQFSLLSGKFIENYES